MFIYTASDVITAAILGISLVLFVLFFAMCKILKVVDYIKFMFKRK